MDGAHHNFVDKMYRRFGLTEHPGYCVIDVKPMFASAGFYPKNNIVLNDIINGSIAHLLYHESSHFLHSCLRKDIWDGEPPKRFDKRRALVEFVADLGALVFLNEYKNKADVNAFVRYQEKDKIVVTASKLLPQKDILQTIANSSVEEADKIISSLTDRSLESFT